MGWARSKHFRMIRLQPRVRRDEEGVGLRHAFGDGTFGNRVAGILCRIALPAQGVQDLDCGRRSPSVSGKVWIAVWWWPGLLVSVR